MENINLVSLEAVHTHTHTHTHTSKLLENKNKKVNKENIIEIWKKDSDET